MTEVFMENATYAKLVAALLNAPPCAFTGRVTENEIKIALGEHGDVWPVSIKKGIANG